MEFKKVTKVDKYETMEYLLVCKKEPKYNIAITRFLPPCIELFRKFFIADIIEITFKIYVENIVEIGNVFVINISGDMEMIKNIKSKLLKNRDYIGREIRCILYKKTDVDTDYKKFIDLYTLLDKVYSKMASNVGSGKVVYKRK
jgi:hypothetical protein